MTECPAPPGYVLLFDDGGAHVTVNNEGETREPQALTSFVFVNLCRIAAE